jgi:hypothetical protein
MISRSVHEPHNFIQSAARGSRWPMDARGRIREDESGKRSDRPKLAKALTHARVIGATVVFAKLDRLTRNVDLLRSLVASACASFSAICPTFHQGLWGAICVSRKPSVAELEAGLISERTKAALAAAKALRWDCQASHTVAFAAVRAQAREPNEPPLPRVLPRNAPGTCFQNCRVKRRGCLASPRVNTLCWHSTLRDNLVYPRAD